MPYKVIIPAKVQKPLDALAASDWWRVREAIDQLASNPRPPGSRKMQSSSESWRIRSGDYRIIYTIEDDRLIVLVIKIGHRHEVYR